MGGSTSLNAKLTLSAPPANSASGSGQTPLKDGGLWEVSASPAPSANAMATLSMPPAPGSNSNVSVVVFFLYKVTVERGRSGDDASPGDHDSVHCSFLET